MNIGIQQKLAQWELGGGCAGTAVAYVGVPRRASCGLLPAPFPAPQFQTIQIYMGNQ